MGDVLNPANYNISVMIMKENNSTAQKKVELLGN